jgi:PBSX family phage terminase large subunit
MLTAKQTEYLNCANSRLNILWGSVRSGKTFVQNLKWIHYCQTGPVGNLVLCGKTERTIKRNVIEPIKEILGNNAYTRQGEFWIGKRKCDVVGVNDARAEEKIRGATLAGAGCDEISLYPESFFDMLRTRLSVPGAQLFGTSNPDSPYHWLKTQYLDNPDLDLYQSQFTLDDNAENLDPAYIADLKNNTYGLFYRRYILGEWVLADGLVYDMFDTQTSENSHGCKTIISVDYGIANPTCFLKIRFNDNHKIVVTDEYYYDYQKTGKQKTDSELAAGLTEFIGNDPITAVYIDPSALSFVNEVKKLRLRVKSVDNEVIPGIAFLSRMFGNRILWVSDKCNNTLRQLTTYSWDPKKQLQGIDAPIKKDDHAMDALRYGVYSHFKNYSPFPQVLSSPVRVNKYVGYR